MTPAANQFLARLPLLSVYVLMPLAVLAGRLAGLPEVSRHFGPQGLGLWLALAGLALVVCLGRDILNRKRQDKSPRSGIILAVAIAAAVFLLLRLFGPALSQARDLAALLDELRLPALIVFAAAWTFSFGTPRREDLARLGAALGAVLVLDFLLTAIMARQVVLGGGFLMGGGQAASNAMALLMCIALSATLDGSEAGADSAAAARWQPALVRWLILAGLFATFSHAGLAAAGIISLLLERGPLQQRLALLCACVLGIWMSLALPLARTMGGGDELGLLWHLSATLEALVRDPRAWLFGLPLDEPLALALPDLFQDALTGEEWVEAEGLPVAVFEIPSSWLRLLAAWGVGAPMLALSGLLACALRGRKRFGFGLLASALVMAALTPVLHAPAPACALALACALAWQASPGARPEPARNAPDAN